ncbi:DUF1330 domain-containing protein [Gluconobacter morbifer]|nr:DUF1330 domain-containing protein [Gluconobacter morbifer]
MSAYVVFTRHKLTDPAEFKAYTEGVGKTFEGHSARLLAVYGNQVNLEGTEPDGVVIIEFPDVKAARAWYDSPAYQAVAQHRRNAAVYDVVIVEGAPAS